MIEFKSLKEFIKSRSDIYELFDELDIFDTSLSSRKLKNGLTFLVPNTAYVSKLKNLAEKSEDSATEQILNLFLPIYLPTVSDWSRNISDIPNMHNKRLQIDNITNDGIKLSNGTRLSRINFNVGKDPVALYAVTGGAVPKGTANTEKKLTKTVTTNSQQSSRNVRKLLYASLHTTNNVFNSCGNYVGSFIKWLSKHDEVLYDAVLPLLDYCPITSFMILFEPDKGGHYLLDEIIIDRWYSTHETNNGLMYLSKALSTKLVCNAHTRGYTSSVDDIRMEILDNKVPSQIINHINGVYNSLVFDNVIGTVNTVLPQTTHMLLKKASQKGYNIKLFQDELRLTISALLSEGVTNNRLLEDVRSYIKLLPALNDIKTASSLSKTEYVARVASLVNTTYFLYVTPTYQGEFGGKPTEYEDIDPYSEEPADLVALKMQELQKKAVIPNKSDVIDNFEELLANGGEGVPREVYLKLKAIMEREE